MNARRHVEWFDIGCCRAGIHVVARATMSPQISDASSVVDTVRTPDAEALVYFGRGPSAFALGLALQTASWKIPVIGNSSLTHGRTRPDQTAAWDGWLYLDMFADTPAVAEANSRLGPEVAAAPVALSFYDMGRLVGEALSQASCLTSRRRAGWFRAGEAPARDRGLPRHHDVARIPGPGRAQRALPRLAPVAEPAVGRVPPGVFLISSVRARSEDRALTSYVRTSEGSGSGDGVDGGSRGDHLAVLNGAFVHRPVLEPRELRDRGRGEVDGRVAPSVLNAVCWLSQAWIVAGSNEPAPATTDGSSLMASQAPIAGS